MSECKYMGRCKKSCRVVRLIQGKREKDRADWKKEAKRREEQGEIERKRTIGSEREERTGSERTMMLEGKIAVVTGASRGIGKAIALQLAEEGAVVIINYNRSEEEAEKVAQQIQAAGGKVKLIQCNVASFESCGQMFETIMEEFGRVDILVNNAGVTKDGLLMKMSEADFNAVVDTNLKGAFHCMRFVSRSMIRQRSGRIINISSVSGLLGNAGQANYAASKAGVIGLTKSAARELAGRGITVNAVAPGFINTEMTSVLSEKVKEKAVSQIPMERFGEAEDVACTVAFLASDQAGYITGQVLCVDGGMAM